MPTSLLASQDYLFPASVSVSVGTPSLKIRSGSAANSVWFAPAGTTTFSAGSRATKAAGDATSIAVPASAGSYKLFVVDSQGKKLGESAALLRAK